jgi:hypothetical protein
MTTRGLVMLGNDPLPDRSRSVFGVRDCTSHDRRFPIGAEEMSAWRRVFLFNRRLDQAPTLGGRQMGLPLNLSSFFRKAVIFNFILKPS